MTSCVADSMGREPSSPSPGGASVNLRGVLGTPFPLRGMTMITTTDLTVPVPTSEVVRPYLLLVHADLGTAVEMALIEWTRNGCPSPTRAVDGVLKRWACIRMTIQVDADTLSLLTVWKTAQRVSMDVAALWAILSVAGSRYPRDNGNEIMPCLT